MTFDQNVLITAVKISPYAPSFVKSDNGGVIGSSWFYTDTGTNIPAMRTSNGNVVTGSSIYCRGKYYRVVMTVNDEGRVT